MKTVFDKAMTRLAWLIEPAACLGTLIVLFALPLHAEPTIFSFKGLVSGISRDSLTLRSQYGIKLFDSVYYKIAVDFEIPGYYNYHDKRIEYAGTKMFFDSLISEPLFHYNQQEILSQTFAGFFVDAAKQTVYNLSQTTLKQDTVIRYHFMYVGDSTAIKSLPQNWVPWSGQETRVIGTDTSYVLVKGVGRAVPVLSFSQTRHLVSPKLRNGRIQRQNWLIQFPEGSSFQTGLRDASGRIHPISPLFSLPGLGCNRYCSLGN